LWTSARGQGRHPKGKAGRIDRRSERRGPDPSQEPSAEFKPVEPQRRLQARPEKPLALRPVELRPAIVVSYRSMRRMSRSFEKRIEQEMKHEKRKSQISSKPEVARSLHFSMSLVGPANGMGWSLAGLPSLGCQGLFVLVLNY
jgi:hypothetical protein